MENFERATRLKLRFQTNAGLLAVEDIWDLPLTSQRGASLDELAKGLRRKLKETEEESFVVKTNAVNNELQLAFDIVNHVIDIKLAEKEEDAAVV